MQSDEELMKAYQAGSEAAFNELFRRYSPIVYGYLGKRIRHDEVADVYQKVWRELHEKRAVFRDQPFAPWFFVLMRNLLIDEYRVLGRQREREKKYVPPTPDSGLDLDELLQDLPVETRDLVKGHYLDEKSYAQLESELGVPQASLRQRVSRALSSLRRKQS